MYARQKGFGGLQIVLVFVLVGLMATIAIPKYKGSISKAKLTEAFNLASASRQKVSEFFMTSGRFPKSMGEIQSVEATTLSPPKHVRELVVESGTADDSLMIKVYLQNDVVENRTGEDQFIYISASRPDDGIYGLEWNCGANGIDLALLPQECRT